MSRGRPTSQMQPVSMGDRNQRLGYMLLSLGGALRGQDPLQSFQQVQQLKQQKELQRQQEEREKKLQKFALTDPSLAKMYELFGERGLQQGYLQQQEQEQALLQQQQLLQAYRDAGLSDEEVSLAVAGLPIKDILEFRDTSGLSGEDIVKKAEENVDTIIEETQVLDTFADLDQAFGPIDASQEALSKATRVLGFDVDPKTGAAVRARNSLNTEILANLAADFTGRPNMLIYENIKGNLPMTAATSERDAMEKYINVKDQVDARIKNLEQGIKSDTVSDSDKEKYREELNKSLLLSKKLDSAILSLKGKPKDVLEPPKDFGFDPAGRYTGLYTNE